MLGAGDAAEVIPTVEPTLAAVEEPTAEPTPTLEPVATVFDELAATAPNTVMGGQVVYA